MSQRTGFTLVLFFDVSTKPGCVTWHAEWHPDFTLHQAQTQAAEYSREGIWTGVSFEGNPPRWGDNMSVFVPWHHIRRIWVMPGQPSPHEIDRLATELWTAMPVYPIERRPPSPRLDDERDDQREHDDDDELANERPQCANETATRARIVTIAGGVRRPRRVAAARTRLRLVGRHCRTAHRRPVPDPAPSSAL